jgi:hypothetical protein
MSHRPPVQGPPRVVAFIHRLHKLLHAVLDYTLGLAIGLVIIKACLLCGNLTSLRSGTDFRKILRKSPIRPLPLPLADRCLNRLRDGHALAELPENFPEVIAAFKAGKFSGLCARRYFPKNLGKSALQDNCPEVRPAG